MRPASLEEDLTNPGLQVPRANANADKLPQEPSRDDDIAVLAAAADSLRCDTPDE
eukprot:CAMPEP_0197686172 /NCGR_PEP_ID=MMETSP1338-20131121/102094_1 /TAXON_ID=43686 ORGANISM="Pelagodinium beii, Strain RCC1491" /NCGR_SAMPLE_ID=MMETSP1338 /ASSEMBLY_ACC=CAM_ASM_000754 /LENGTH=54 /DNA_ID=CAMNT_0043268083 /DNA_START=51 /DNA_END=212 /DNA_ORIENTATION=+